VAIFMSVVLSYFSAASADFTGYKVEGRFSNVTGVSPSEIKVILNGGQYSTFVRVDGGFALQDVSAGTHWLEVVCAKYAFDPVTIHVSAKHNGRIKATVFDDPSFELRYPLRLQPVRVAQYFEIREPFSFGAYLKNPMVLMMGVTLLIGFVMPKLAANVDPEEMKRVQAELKGERQGPIQSARGDQQTRRRVES